MCGYIDEYTKEKTSYIYREKEIDELRKLKEMGFYDRHTLIKFSDLQNG